MGNVAIAAEAAPVQNSDLPLQRAARGVLAASAFEQCISDRTRHLQRSDECTRWTLDTLPDGGSNDEHAEGFICPDCRLRHANADALAAHFARAHGEMASHSAGRRACASSSLSNAGGIRRTISLDGVTFSEDDVVMEGWMVKQGHFIRNWKKRYFTLTRDTLWYTSERPRRRVPSTSPRAEEEDWTDWVDVFAEDHVSSRSSSGGR